MEAPDFMLGCGCEQEQSRWPLLAPVFICLAWGNTDICRPVLGLVSQAGGRAWLLWQTALDLLPLKTASGESIVNILLSKLCKTLLDTKNLCYAVEKMLD